MERFRGRVVVVTGASAGIGQAVAKNLAVDHGMKVVGCARRVERLTEMEKTYNDLIKETNSGGRFFAFKCDLQKDDDIKNMFQWIRDHPDLGHVDICICNAGIVNCETLSTVSTDAWRKIWDVNVVGASYCAQLAVNMMIEKGIKDGQVIFINSVAGHRNMDDRNIVIYNASKLALTCVVEGWRREVQHLGDNKIRVSQISPGAVKTEIGIGQHPDWNESVFENIPHLTGEQIAFEVVHHMSAHPDMLIRDSIVTHVLGVIA